MSEASFFCRESILLESIPEKLIGTQFFVEKATHGLKDTMTATALEHLEMGAHECLARAGVASNHREDLPCYSPLQHAFGRAPDLDGRFYTPEHEALPTAQAG